MKYSDKFDSAYDASKYEGEIYKKWEASGYFNPDKCIDDGIADLNKESFSIVLPPPNITGHLHIGHAAMLAIEDVLVRYHRMTGKPTLWLPGTDHAAIATQSKFEKLHQKETGKRRNDYSRDEFFELVNEYALSNKKYIEQQLKDFGSSLDWSRLAFTLDEDRQAAVLEAFKQMYESGLIYQKDRIVNWDPKGQTTVSDDEIVYQSGKATLYTFKYSPDFPIQISTTRLETKVGDVAVAVHPDDVRYQPYIGKSYDIDDFCGVPLSIKIIASEEVDPEYGTGALGVTPAHSQIDWDMAEAHNLPTDKVVINEYAKMTDTAGILLAGQKTKIARETVASWLRDNDLMISEVETDQNLSTAERTGGIIEPLPKLQWWVAVDKEFELLHDTFDKKAGESATLKELMLQAVKESQTEIIPERYERVYFDWINKLRDWNISRQIIYGHRVPVWHKGDEIKISLNSPGNDWIQDEDTLDTWFSSGLWPFSTMGWPNDTDDLKRYFPNTLLETGYDIIFFWVARMILMSVFFTGQSPFKTVYMHGLVRDEHGRKMSKSLGNTMEPKELTAKYGTDALRMALLVGVGPGADNNLGEPKVKAYRNFANKIWNATRFTLMSLPDNYVHKRVELTNNDQELINELRDISDDVTSDIENYRLHLAAEKLYGYFWHRFADVIIESKKDIVGDNYADSIESKSAAYTLYEILTTSLKLLHPFMPFVTEEIWQEFSDENLLLIERWPSSDSV